MKTRYYAAPMEGVTGAMWRRTHQKYFPGADQYYTPFLTPTQAHKLTPREKRELLPEYNGSAVLVPQIMTRQAENFIWCAGAMGELGKPYYKIPCGGSNAIGALGYVGCMEEISKSGVHFDHIICAEGSGGTHAGVALGAKLFLPGTKTMGIMVDSDPFDVITLGIMRETAALLQTDVEVGPEDIHLLDMCGPGYAIPSPEGNAAIRLMAENEGLFLDPVYTGKAFAGLVKLAREGAFKPEDNVLFLYSGGAGGLFAVDVDLG